MDPTFQTQILTQLSQKLIFNFSNKGKDIRYKIVSRGWSGLKNAWDRPVTDVTYSRAGSSSFPFLGIPIFVFGLPPNLTPNSYPKPYPKSYPKSYPKFSRKLFFILQQMTGATVCSMLNFDGPGTWLPHVRRSTQAYFLSVALRQASNIFLFFPVFTPLY